MRFLKLFFVLLPCVSAPFTYVPDALSNETLENLNKDMASIRGELTQLELELADLIHRFDKVMRDVTVDPINLNDHKDKIIKLQNAIDRLGEQFRELNDRIGKLEKNKAKGASPEVSGENVKSNLKKGKDKSAKTDDKPKGDSSASGKNNLPKAKETKSREKSEEPKIAKKDSKPDLKKASLDSKPAKS
ncbi:MAG: hypothetical protein LBJ92_00675 [Holosporales bacterium]|jgi:uncharacterized protein YoxC|nr:hypothetical protein [Holosporales bacterium]